MSRIIGDRTKSALDEMEEVARERNRDVAEEDRLERIEEERKRREGIIAKTEETIKVPSDDAKGLLEKINNIAKDTSGLYYDGEKDFELITKISVRSTASVAIANFLAGNKNKAAECFGNIGINLGKGIIGRENNLFTNLSEAYTADNAYIAIYCFLEGSSGSGKDILEEIEKRIPKTGGGDGYGLSQTNKAYCLSSQALMHAAKAYGGFGDLVERMKYERLKKLRERHGLYEDSKSKGTTKATASMAFLACLYNDKQHAKELLGLLSKFKTHEGLYKAAHNENAIYTEDNALVAIASFLSA